MGPAPGASSMPLLGHFRPPLNDRLPAGYFPEANDQFGIERAGRIQSPKVLAREVLPMSANPDAVLAEEERLAEEVYDRLVRPALRPEDDGKFVAVAFEVGDFEVDADDYAATGRLLARRPGARLWLMRTGPSAAYRLRGLAADAP